MKLVIIHIPNNIFGGEGEGVGRALSIHNPGGINKKI